MCQALVTTRAKRRRRRAPTTGMTAIDVRADFQRARRAYLFARTSRWLTTRRPSRTRPRDLGDVAALSWRTPGLRPIPLEAIVGTVDAAIDFDAGFRPATDRIAPRWESIARAHRDGRSLPPISVLERPDGYYVLDGRHRVSVARALGHGDIDAWTSPAGPAAPSSPPQPTTTNPERPMTQLTRRFRVALSNALRDHHAEAPVHFHAGDDGRPYVCENLRCSSPNLTTSHR
jgi:hypothetical protein